MTDPTTQAAVERLSKDSARLKASAGYCSHDGTPRSEDNTRWNAAFATDIDTVLADHATQAACIAELEGAAIPVGNLPATIDAILQQQVHEDDYPKGAHRFFQECDPYGDRADAVTKIMGAVLAEAAASALSGQPAAPSLPVDRIAELFLDLIGHLPRRSYGYVITSVLPVDKILEEALGLLAPFADRVAGEENNLPRCEDCGAPEGMDCRTVQGRIPPHLSRVLALSAPTAAVAEQTEGEA